MVQKVQKGELQKKFSTLSSQLKVVRRPAWRQTNSAPRNTTSDGNRMAINITIATVASRSRATSEEAFSFWLLALSTDADCIMNVFTQQVPKAATYPIEVRDYVC